MKDSTMVMPSLGDCCVGPTGGFMSGSSLII